MVDVDLSRKVRTFFRDLRNTKLVEVEPGDDVYKGIVNLILNPNSYEKHIDQEGVKRPVFKVHYALTGEGIYDPRILCNANLGDAALLIESRAIPTYCIRDEEDGQTTIFSSEELRTGEITRLLYSVANISINPHKGYRFTNEPIQYVQLCGHCIEKWDNLIS